VRVVVPGVVRVGVLGEVRGDVEGVVVWAKVAADRAAIPARAVSMRVVIVRLLSWSFWMWSY
jgi:hypothetical protein